MKTKKLLLLLVLVVCAFMTANSAEKYYIGGVGGTTTAPVGGMWSSTAAWSPSGTPTSTDDIIINANGSNVIAITNITTALANINSLTINGIVTFGGNAQQITIGSGGLTINGSLTMPAGGANPVKIIGGTGFSASGTGSFTSAAVNNVLPNGTASANINYPFDVTLTYFQATAAQTLPTYATFNNLTINFTNAAVPAKVGNNTIVNRRLTLTNGLIDCQANTLILSSTASIVGGSTASHIYSSTGTGALVLACPQTIATLFPIGTATAYTPLTVTNTGVATTDITSKLKTTFTTTAVDATKSVMLEWSLLGSVATTADLVFTYNTANFGTAYAVASPSVLAAYNGTNYSKVATGTATGTADPYTYPASGINIPATGTNSFVITNKTAPAAPAISGITVSDGQLSVAYSAPVWDGGSAITDYKYTIDGTTYISAGSTTSPIVITGLTNNTAYPIQLEAVNSVGVGTASAIVSATPSNTTAVNTPQSNVNVSTRNGKIVVKTDAEQTINIYNSIGRKIYSSVTKSGVNEIAVTDRSVYFVKVANQTSKIIL